MDSELAQRAFALGPGAAWQRGSSTSWDTLPALPAPLVLLSTSKDLWQWNFLPGVTPCHAGDGCSALPGGELCPGTAVGIDGTSSSQGVPNPHTPDGMGAAG